METAVKEYNSVLFAKYIIAWANDKGIPINMTKTQKLLYISYGVWLAVIGTRLLNEHPQAWPYGPVFPTTRKKLLKIDFYKIRKDCDEFEALTSNEDITGMLNLVFETYGDWTASMLSTWSHQNGSPWERAVDRPGFKWGDRIADEDIQGYFKMKMNLQ